MKVTRRKERINLTEEYQHTRPHPPKLPVTLLCCCSRLARAARAGKTIAATTPRLPWFTVTTVGGCSFLRCNHHQGPHPRAACSGSFRRQAQRPLPPAAQPTGLPASCCCCPGSVLLTFSLGTQPTSNTAVASTRPRQRSDRNSNGCHEPTTSHSDQLQQTASSPPWCPCQPPQKSPSCSAPGRVPATPSQSRPRS